MLQAKIGFSNTELKIAEYILEHCHQASNISANALARETFCSATSVIRMCRKIGFSGYREFQIALAARLSKQESQAKSAHEYDFVSHIANAETMIKALSEAMTNAVESCLKGISPESLLRSSVWMSQARRLYVYGVDYLSASAFCHTMSKKGIVCTVPALFHEKPYRDKKSLTGDVALFIAYSDCGLQEEMSLLRERGCRVISVSAENASPDADISICFPECNTGCPCAEAAYAQTAFLYITTCMNYMTKAVKRAES
jgi:DNA-binding MurR/RpiR family transcriptional regulator